MRVHFSRYYESLWIHLTVATQDNAYKQLHCHKMPVRVAMVNTDLTVNQSLLEIGTLLYLTDKFSQCYLPVF